MKKIKFISLASVAMLLAGCSAPTVKTLMTPNGALGYLVTCDGSADDWATCYAESTKACGGKYAVVDRNESSTPTAYGPLVRRNMVIECKK